MTEKEKNRLRKTVELMRYPHHDDWFGLGFAVVTGDRPKPKDLGFCKS